MAEKASPTAIVALCISIVTAAFSIYQWWNSERESRVTTAIEISKDYLRQAENNQKILPIVLKFYIGNERPSMEEILALTGHADNLQYIAFLANTGKLDKSYLSLNLICDMIFTEAATSNLAKMLPFLAKYKEKDHELADFSRNAHCAAKDLLATGSPQSN
jgi:hypothetical protein